MHCQSRSRLLCGEAWEAESEITLGRHCDNSIGRVFKSGWQARCTPPRRRRSSHESFERPIKSSLGFITHPGGDIRNAMSSITEHLPGQLDAPCSKVVHG